MELKGKVALVTGAGRRVGRTIALNFASRGAEIAVHYRSSRAEAEDLAAQITRQGGRGQAFAADLERVGEIERMVVEVIGAMGRIDVLVNSASVFYRKPLEELTEHDWDVNLNTNLKAPFFLSKFTGAAMRRQGAGKIVNIGDWAGIRPYSNYLPYTVSKSGLIGLTRGLAKALAPEVQVNCVAIGPVLPPEDASEEEIARMLAGALTQRLGLPEDGARAGMVLFECTDIATRPQLVAY